MRYLAACSIQKIRWNIRRIFFSDFESVFFPTRFFHKSHKSKYHSIYKNENFGTRFVRDETPLQKCQPLDHSAVVGTTWAWKVFLGGFFNTKSKQDQVPSSHVHGKI